MEMAELTSRLPELHAMAGGGVDLDLSAVVAALLFLALYAFLRATLFTPYIRITEKRDALTGGAMEEAEALSARAAELDARYEALKVEASSEAAAARDALRAKAKGEEEALLSAARDASTSKLSAHREALEKQVAAAEAQIEARAQELSGAIVKRLAPEAG